MTTKRKSKKTVATIERLGGWDDAALSDQDAFERLIVPYLPDLSKLAREQIHHEQRQGNNAVRHIQPAELVSETLIDAWSLRSPEAARTPLKEWLFDVQAHTFRKMLKKEQEQSRPIVLSLQEPVPEQEETADENELFRRWVETPIRDRWQDVIADTA